jgi:hypothetical protein
MSVKQWVLKILSGQNISISILNDLNLLPIDLKINRGLPLLITNPHMKYHNNLMKGSQDIEWTSSALPTDRQVQSNMPLFFEGGHDNVLAYR